MKYVKPEIDEIELLSSLEIICSSSEVPYEEEEYNPTSHDIEQRGNWDEGDY